MAHPRLAGIFANPRSPIACAIWPPAVAAPLPISGCRKASRQPETRFLGFRLPLGVGMGVIAVYKVAFNAWSKSA
ncbi:hypothetical protein [Kingella oralis]|uniref:hypothetical protein n=1 Tax=Kingella oralis TaxID=505 RepID=UPI0034E580D9